MIEELQKKNYLAYFCFQHLLGISASVLYSVYFFKIQEKNRVLFYFHWLCCYTMRFRSWMEVLVCKRQMSLNQGQALLCILPFHRVTHTISHQHSYVNSSTQSGRKRKLDFYTTAAWAWKTMWACLNMVEDCVDSYSLLYCYVSTLWWRVTLWSPLPLLHITVLLR